MSTQRQQPPPGAHDRRGRRRGQEQSLRPLPRRRTRPTARTRPPTPAKRGPTSKTRRRNRRRQTLRLKLMRLMIPAAKAKDAAADSAGETQNTGAGPQERHTEIASRRARSRSARHCQAFGECAFAGLADMNLRENSRPFLEPPGDGLRELFGGLGFHEIDGAAGPAGA